jgi:prepilin-type N-terminal cleavage/methylation domain-containing protein
MRRAFTLVELLVALVIAVSIAAAVMGSVSAGFRLWGKIREAGAQDTDSLFAFETMARQLRQSVRLGGKALAGSDTAFSFVTIEQGAIVRRFYRFDAMSGKLLTASQPLAALREDKECEAQEQFLAGVGSFSVSYLGRPRAGTKPEWTGSWEEKEGLPAAVRVEAARQGKTLSRTVCIPQDPSGEKKP